MIKINALHKSFGNLKVLKGIDLRLDAHGSITAILGPNGSGKTTLIKCILGMVIPSAGQILFDEKPIKNNFRYRSNISYLPQIAKFPENLSARELITLIKSFRNQTSNESRLISLFDLESELDKRFAELSGGTKQKFNIVLALMYDNPVIIMDEPTTGLDPLSSTQFKKLLDELRQEGKIIVLTSHIMNFVEEIADEVIFILDGKIEFRDKPEAFLKETRSYNLESAIADILKKNGISSNGQERVLKNMKPK